MFKKSIVLIGVICWSVVSYAQQSNLPINEADTVTIKASSQVHAIECLGLVNPASDDLDLMPNLFHKASENDGPDPAQILKIKEEAAKLRLAANKTDATQQTQSVVSKPLIGKNFIGNYDPYGCPQDNTIAISKGGKVVCIVNSTINYYDITTGTYKSHTFTKSMNSFYNGIYKLAVNSNLCDPKVIYDPINDRFIMFTQTCNGIDTASHILLSFSKSNDPAAGWYVYKLSGNFNTIEKSGANTWFDYPKMGISTNELFITGNLFDNSFSRQGAAIYEITKSSCFSGTTMKFKYWSSVSGATNSIPQDPFTILPVSNGQTSSYGPGIWLVASVASPGFYGSGYLKLYNITDDLTSKTQALKYYKVTLSNTYNLGPSIPQKGTTSNLDNGDCRMQSGFILHGIIHCVFTSMNGSGYNAINYTRINVSSGSPASNVNKLISDPSSADLCYPAVASFTTNPTNQTALLAFVRSSSSMYPEFDVARVDDSMNVSDFVTVVAGNYHNTLCYDSSHKAVRWGDYTGVSYRPGTGTAVWVSGSYGDGNSSLSYWSTYIAEVYKNDVGVSDINTSPVTNEKISPNPVTDRFQYSFTLNDNTNINITLLDVNGRLVNIMYQGAGLKGENIFTFNRGALPNGIYFVRISDGINILGFEKIVISH